MLQYALSFARTMGSTEHVLFSSFTASVFKNSSMATAVYSTTLLILHTVMEIRTFNNPLPHPKRMQSCHIQFTKTSSVFV